MLDFSPVTLSQEPKHMYRHTHMHTHTHTLTRQAAPFPDILTQHGSLQCHLGSAHWPLMVWVPTSGSFPGNLRSAP